MQQMQLMIGDRDVHKGYVVGEVTRAACEPYILHRHYAKRWPSISYAYGLFRDGTLCGIVTYGTPASAPLRAGVAGKEMAQYVIELNRLCLADNLPNEASRLVSGSLRLLPRPLIVVSFADTQQGHLGTIYQACSFTYHGLSAKRTDWRIKGQEHLHGQTVADEFRSKADPRQKTLFPPDREPTRSEAMRTKYGDDFYLADRPRKHRYIKLVGSTGWRRETAGKILYPVEAYPKKQA